MAHTTLDSEKDTPPNRRVSKNERGLRQKGSEFSPVITRQQVFIKQQFQYSIDFTDFNYFL